MFPLFYATQVKWWLVHGVCCWNIFFGCLSVVTQLLLSTPQVLQKDLIDVSDFKELLVNDNLHSAKAVLTEVLKNVPEHGKLLIYLP